jgi:carboxypeptidase C (cathepsin A)
LTENKHSWHKVSNLLFLESPAGVGYSYNTNLSFHNNDYTTAHDNMIALLDFFKKYPEYLKNPFWIAGESYAGKYIPDLAVLIDQYNLNSSSQINLKGILIGNGVMSFGQLPYS